MNLNQEIEEFLIERGAIKVGFADRESLAGGPPSTDITYKLPEAKSAIVFAIPETKEIIRSYIAKKLPNGRSDYEIEQFDLHLKIWNISKKLVNFLEDKGHKGVAFFPNNKYREGTDVLQGKLMPELSLRLVAVRSGVASFGWSGNVGIKDHGTTILLGGIVTSAELEPTDPIPQEESFCDNCKLCARVCSFKMFSDKDEFTFIIGGYEFSYAKRIDKRRCMLVCGGLQGLHHTGKYSTWSPGRYLYPQSKEEVTDLFVQAAIASANRPKISDKSGGYKTATGLGYNIQLTCGNCNNICFGNPKETAENYKILKNSGCVIQHEDGSIEILPPEKAEEVFLRMDPIHQRLYTQK